MVREIELVTGNVQKIHNDKTRDRKIRFGHLTGLNVFLYSV